MFKTILIPTDGSALSAKAVDAAIEFAKFSGAKVIGLSVAEPYPYAPLAESSMASDPAIYEENMRALAQRHVDNIAEAASKADVRCETLIAQSFNPYEEIIKAANQFGCDVIFMASHGRKGLSRLFVGSETQKVLAHTTVPVLVFR